MKPGCWKYVSGRLRPRFTLRGMLAFVAILAAGLALMDRSRPDWLELPWNMLTIWVAIGLVAEAQHLWKTFRDRKELNTDERWTWRWAVAWRVAAAGLLCGVLLFEFMLSREFVVLPIDGNFIFAIGSDARWTSYWLVLASVLFSLLAPRSTVRRRSIWSGVTTATVIIAAAIWAMRVWWNETFIHWLVYIAVLGIERSEPIFMAVPNLDVNAVARANTFMKWSSVAAFAVCCNAVCVLGLSRSKPGQRIRDWFLYIALAVGWVTTMSYFAWVMRRGLYELTPALTVEPQWAPLEAWISAAVMLVVFTLVAAHRLIVKGASESLTTAPPLRWRRDDFLPFRFGISFPTTLSALWIASFGVREIGAYLNQSTGYLSDQETLEYLLIHYPIYVPVAVFILSLRTTWIAWRHPVRMRNMSLTVISPRRFAAIWLALFATIITAAPALAGFTFSLWLTPWWKLPLPEG